MVELAELLLPVNILARQKLLDSLKSTTLTYSLNLLARQKFLDSRKSTTLTFSKAFYLKFFLL